jgi:hypothetical protein
MPFLALVHLRDLACAECGAPVASAGARSFIVDDAGDPVSFAENDVPAGLQVELCCANGHANLLYVPNEIGAEDTLRTPDDAPIGPDATMVA